MAVRSPQKQEGESRADSARSGSAGPSPNGVAKKARPARRVSRARKVPLVRLLLYYVAICAVAFGIAAVLPVAHDAFVAPISAPSLDQAGQVLGNPAAATAIAPAESRLDRPIITLLVILGGLALSLPIAWVYMYTRRLRYDPSLVHSIIILPVVVAGIVILVKHSLALAFSLAGIVAVVRFRNTLKDPKDAVYIFLVAGVGLAAGVQALDVALLVSASFNLIVMGLWKYDVGGIYSAPQGGLLTIGDDSLLPHGTARQKRRQRQRVESIAEKLEIDGYLVVYAADAAAARQGVEVTLSELADDWRVEDPKPGPGGLSSFVVPVALRSKTSPVDLLGNLDERWSAQIAAAEYVPLKRGPVDEEED